MPSDYFKLLDFKDKTRRTLRILRMAIVDYLHYYTLDFYPDVSGRPLILIIRKTHNLNIKQRYPHISEFINICREVTNETMYFPENLAKHDFEMNKPDLDATKYDPEFKAKKEKESVKQKTPKKLQSCLKTPMSRQTVGQQQQSDVQMQRDRTKSFNQEFGMKKHDDMMKKSGRSTPKEEETHPKLDQENDNKDESL